VLTVLHAFILLSLWRILTEDLRVGDNLLQEPGVRDDRVVHGVQLRAVAELDKQLLVGLRQCIQVFSSPIVCGQLLYERARISGGCRAAERWVDDRPRSACTAKTSR
jgi:hypothetical protein